MVPVALLAAVALVRVAPAVEAAQSVAHPTSAGKGSSSPDTAQSVGVCSGSQVVSIDLAQAVHRRTPLTPDVAPPPLLTQSRHR